MGRFCVILLMTVLVPAAASAQVLSARELATHCRSADQSEGRATCLLVVKAFMDGFIEGTAAGVCECGQSAREGDGAQNPAARRSRHLHPESERRRNGGSVREIRRCQSIDGRQELPRAADTHDHDDVL